MSMTAEEKLEKIKKLADAMYYAAANLGPTVGSGEKLRKTMEEYHKFIIHEYHKEEPVSEDIWEASKQYALRQVLASTDTKMSEQAYLDLRLFSGFELAVAHKDGAKWQKENLWKPADGDDLPEYDREVIAILDYDFGHYKVVYAHRPNPNGWNGTNIDTEEKEHFEPEIYDKGGWNQPHVLYWLDTILPYEESKTYNH